MFKIDFVGIGISKAGTTWLHQNLMSHPDCKLPKYRKELGYFSKNYNKGPKWLESFFEAPINANHVVGEITPHYFDDEDAPQKIKDHGVQKIILMLRDPIDRFKSSFEMYRRFYNYKGNINEFIVEKSEFLERSMYSIHMKNYLKHFAKDEILILISESTKKDPYKSLKKVCDFLNISWDPKYFPNANKKVNTSKILRFPVLFSIFFNIGRAFRYFGLNKAYTHLTRILKPLLIKEEKKLANKDYLILSNENFAYLREKYKKDIKKLSLLVDLDLDLWTTTLEQNEN